MSSDLNHVTMIGRLTRDAELKYTSGGMAVSKFAIAVNRRKKDGEQWVEEASFFDVVLWGRAGETLNQYLTKGKQVAVEGSLHQNRWVQDGQVRSKVEIMAENVHLLGGGQGAESGRERTQAGQDGNGHQSARPDARAAPARNAQEDRQAAASDARQPTFDETPDFPDDIPF